MIDKPLYGNPLAGGVSLDMGKYEGNPNFQGLTGPMQMSNAGMKIDPFQTVKPELKGNPELTPIVDPSKPKSDDPLMQGYFDSEFFSNIQTADMVPYTYDGKEMMGSSSGASNLKKYLESIGKGDLLQFKNNDVMSVELAKVSGSEDSLTQPDNNAMIPGDPSAFTPPEFNDTGIFNSPSETTGQYLTGPNEDGNVLETLKNIEQGIASLGVNYGQGNNMNQSSNYGNFSNFGIGSFFPPYGGLYG